MPLLRMFFCVVAVASVAILSANSLAVQAGGSANTLTKKEKADGWRLLFDGKTLDGWRRYNRKDTKGWTVKGGAIYLEKKGSGDLMTVGKYSDFEFSIDWKFQEGNNSGIIYRAAEIKGPPWRTGPEMQVMTHKPGSKLGKTGGGSLYAMFAPKTNPLKPRDQWNTFKVLVKGKHIEHWVNGVKVVDCTIGSDDWNERLAKSKWRKIPEFATKSTGHIALQDHGHKIMFRNAKIRVISNE